MAEASRGSRRYKALVVAFKEMCRERGAVCARCGQPIDYDAPAWHPSSFQGGHIRSWESFPEGRLDPANFQPEHALCNQVAGDRDVQPGLGVTSTEW